MWWALDKHKVSTKYVGLIKDVNNNVVTSVRTSDGDTDDFPIRIWLHQGSALSHYLFALVIDEVTRDIQGDIPWCMLFADDVVLVDESRTWVNYKLELWWVLTPKFGKPTLERKRSADDVKNKIIEDICLLTSVLKPDRYPLPIRRYCLMDGKRLSG